MNPDHAHFADWDAAYVLGALSPSERRRFEAHLEQCPLCRAAIAEVAPTLGLLSRVAPERAQSMLDAPDEEKGPDAAARGRLIELGERRTRRRRALWWGGALAAAAVVVVAVVLAVTTSLAPSVRGVQVVALEPVVDAPLTASVELAEVAWGTRIEMTCRYGEAAGADVPEGGWPYALVVTSTDGTESEVSSWRALPGSTARLSAGSALDPDEIASIEIRAIGSGRVLMRTELDPAGE